MSANLSYLYPDVDKMTMLRQFENEDRHKSESPTGYIQSEIVMVAKTRYVFSLIVDMINSPTCAGSPLAAAHSVAVARARRRCPTRAN